jgi:hypothetical protein
MMSDNGEFIDATEAEELAALRTERYFRERTARGDRADFLAILEKAGSDVAVEGDELPLAP